MTHNNHHFVPAFLLREWQSGSEKKLYVYKWANNELKYDRRKAKSVAKELHLYSTGKDTATPDTSIEREFMGPMLDGPAATVHKLLLENGSVSTEQERKYWARFLVSQMVRTPKMIEVIRARGRAVLASQLIPLSEESGNETTRYISAAELADQAGQHIIEDLGTNTLPHIITSDVLNSFFLNAIWEIRKINRSTSVLMIGDTPLIYEGQMSADALFCLPLAPNCVFFAYSKESTGERIRKTKDESLVKDINREQVFKAQTFVFANDLSNRPLVLRRLRKI